MLDRLPVDKRKLAKLLMRVALVHDWSLAMRGGENASKLESAAGRNIEFLGWADDASVAEIYGACQALIFPCEEDFGIVPLEAQKPGGRPIIGYGKGGLSRERFKVKAQVKDFVETRLDEGRGRA